MSSCADRIGALRKEMAASSRDGLFITHEANVTYLSGFRGHDSGLFITKKKAVFITDSRYIEEASACLADSIDIKLSTAPMAETAGSLARKMRVRKLGFEGMRLAYSAAKRLGRYSGAAVTPTIDLVENLRSVKDQKEISDIRRSADLAASVLKKATHFIRPGISEETAARMIESEFLQRGARQSFSTIVASGQNTSKPHARPDKTRIRNKSFAMIDMGCILKGYCSDITRMLLFGRPSLKLAKIYRIVSTAQELAIGLIRPGIAIAHIDRAARGVIERHGYGKYFGHALGHGIGLEVHEKPTISQNNKGVLEPGMVFTVEPAIYIPRFGGVRIEDMVLVTKAGCEILTR